MRHLGLALLLTASGASADERCATPANRAGVFGGSSHAATWGTVPASGTNGCDPGELCSASAPTATGYAWTGVTLTNCNTVINAPGNFDSCLFNGINLQTTQGQVVT